jgi:hypothetical protein
MSVTILEPRLELLREEYVLVQAWKKTATYIRNHNWYSDTLELDRTAVNLPKFLTDLSDSISHPENWTNAPLRLVPAPKSQRWNINRTNKEWEPVERKCECCKITAARACRP